MGYTKRFLLWFLTPYLVSVIIFYFVTVPVEFWLPLTLVLASLSFFMAYGAKYTTDYLVKTFGPGVESKPSVRRMYETGDFTKQKVAYLLILCVFSLNILLALFNRISSALPIGLAVGFAFFTGRDCVHDYLIYRDVKRRKVVEYGKKTN